MDASTFPTWRGRLEYVCVECKERFPGDQLLYTCPKCGSVLLLEDCAFDELKKTPADQWRALFTARKASTYQQLRGIFRFYELIAPVFDQEDIIYLGEASTPLIPASGALGSIVGADFGYKNDGQNPSASFKDRGMACAFSCIKWLSRIHNWDEVLAICASTGDTSAAAALYASYIGAGIKSVVILPEGKVTPQQLSQPLGSGATVIEIPGVFDDCMRVVERLADNYRVALLNSKNSWRILGQESYAYEVADWLNWDLAAACLFVPIGNAGNITAILRGLLKLLELGLISALPHVFGVQSAHADPVFRFYDAPEEKRVWRSVEVRPSVAQAAMIGNPVSFPRLRKIAQSYIQRSSPDHFQVLRVSEQEIIEAMLLANRHGHIACTQGGECLAGLRQAVREKRLPASSFAILDSTAHALKFMDFQNRYFEENFAPEYEISYGEELVNRPVKPLPANSRASCDAQAFAQLAARAIADQLGLEQKGSGDETR